MVYGFEETVHKLRQISLRKTSLINRNEAACTNKEVLHIVSKVYFLIQKKNKEKRLKSVVNILLVV